MNDERFDQLLNEMRDESASPEQIASAKERVWKQLQTPRACMEFRPDLETYIAGALPEARRLLLEDHLSRCTACRTAVAELRGKIVAISRPARKAAATWPRWAAAAAVLVGGVYLSSDRIDAALAPSGPRATVVTVTGDVFRWPQGSIAAGGTLAEGETIRTGSGARALLRLADGSQVEMNQRTELAVAAAWSGQTLKLSRGDVMVEAAKQRRGHLRVVTHDSTVSVKGTVFEVSSGTAGSVVSVVEGSVAVSQAGSQRLLTKGETAASNPTLVKDVHDMVGWSTEAEKYSAILGEIANLEKAIAANPAPRTQPRLLRYLPEGVQIYIAIPNLTGSIRQALVQFEQRAHENTVLNQWWTSAQGAEVRTTLDRIQSATPLLGEEMVFALVRGNPGFYPLILSEVQAGREAALRDALGHLVTKEKIPYQVSSNLMVISDTPARAAAVMSRGGGSAQFATEIAQRYERGAGWLAAVDMSTLPVVRDNAHTQAIGLSNVRYLFFEQGAGGRADDNQLTLSFNGARSGFASWLAPAGSAGSTEYISPEAVAVLSASTKDPRQAFDELVAVLGSYVGDRLNVFETETGVSVGAGIAGSLGTDFTLAIERASIPLPGWIAALEVVRPGVLDSTIERLVNNFNIHQNGESAQKLSLKQETASGRTWTTISGPGGLSLYWTYDRGYMLLSMDRAILTRAIALHDSGGSLIHSASFRDQFPPSGGLHQSGFIWVNAAATGLALLAPNPALKSLLSSREPILVILDGKSEQIRAASRTRLTSMILDAMLVNSPQLVPAPGKAAGGRARQLVRIAPAQ